MKTTYYLGLGLCVFLALLGFVISLGYEKGDVELLIGVVWLQLLAMGFLIYSKLIEIETRLNND